MTAKPFRKNKGLEAKQITKERKITIYSGIYANMH